MPGRHSMQPTRAHACTHACTHTLTQATTSTPRSHVRTHAHLYVCTEYHTQHHTQHPTWSALQCLSKAASALPLLRLACAPTASRCCEQADTRPATWRAASWTRFPGSTCSKLQAGGEIESRKRGQGTMDGAGAYEAACWGIFAYVVACADCVHVCGHGFRLQNFCTAQ